MRKVYAVGCGFRTWRTKSIYLLTQAGNHERESQCEQMSIIVDPALHKTLVKYKYNVFDVVMHAVAGVRGTVMVIMRS